MERFTTKEEYNACIIVDNEYGNEYDIEGKTNSLCVSEICRLLNDLNDMR